MSKFESFVDKSRWNDLLQKKDMEIAKLSKLLGKKEAVQEKEEDKKFNVLLFVLAVIGVITAVAGICYLVYRYFHPDYLEDFDDDFDDDFEITDIPEEDDALYEDEE